jgi:hypothetical protein
MADILGVVSYEMLRATSGMTDTDVDDAQIEALNIELEVEINLEAWIPFFPSVLDDTWTHSKPNAQEFVKKRLLAYIKYYSAALLCKSAAGFMLRHISDGANVGQRFASTNPSELTDKLMLKANEFKAMIEEFLKPVTQEVQFSFFSLSKPNYDPVLGE